MKNRILSALPLFALGLSAFWFASCSTTGPVGSSADSAYYKSKPSKPRSNTVSESLAGGSAAAWSPPAPEPYRPGLGTTWGEDQKSEISWGSFARTSSSPSGVAKIFYNDKDGAKAMADSSGFRWRSDGRTTTSDGAVTLSLKSGFRTLKGFAAGGEEFVVGESGQRYAIQLKNNTSRRVEVVVSVDGLDVMDGRTASYRKRGYLLAPNATFTVKGFRRSLSEVAAFRFSSVASSYASLKHGDTRNVGVIGAAVFQEQTSPEVKRRFAADPFASAP